MQQKEKDSINETAEFITKASLCDFNALWVCTHCDNKGNRCTEICDNYAVKGIKNGVPSNT